MLPGVGNFGARADALRRSGLDGVVRSAVHNERPLLGICVGLQLLYEDSEESPRTAGLGILQGSVHRLPGSLRLPQMQWNTVQRVANRSSVLLEQDEEPSWFYFVHAVRRRFPIPARPRRSSARVTTTATSSRSSNRERASAPSSIPRSPRRLGSRRFPASPTAASSG